MPKPQPTKDKFWEEFDQLIEVPVPTSEWRRANEIAARYGVKTNVTRFLNDLVSAGKLECSRFLSENRRLANYYRVKK